MSVYIGHASLDENGKISGGKAGDQTGKEVCKRTFYNHAKGWVGLRPKSGSVAEMIAATMEKCCDNNNIGYDQGGRLTLYDTCKALNFRLDISTLRIKVECDCSSLVRVCLAYAGIKVANFTTANEKSVLLATKQFDEIKVEKDGSNLKRGDILVTKKTKGHTIVVLSNSEVKEVSVTLKTLKKGSKNNQVTMFESMMKELGFYKGTIDTDFGAKCVTACNEFQKKYPECGSNGKPDGVFGPKCWSKLFSLFKS